MIVFLAPVTMVVVLRFFFSCVSVRVGLADDPREPGDQRRRAEEDDVQMRSAVADG